MPRRVRLREREPAVSTVCPEAIRSSEKRTQSYSTWAHSSGERQKRSTEEVWFGGSYIAWFAATMDDRIAAR